MKKLVLVFVTLVFVLSTSFGPNAGSVYVCKGPKSKRYHYDKDCRGLSRCSTKVYKVSLEEARNMGRTLCGWED
ncbi:hypothetical protein [Gilvibacter sediminis]|uniref:hypothetical protein n=1 Tax=Gilvibacter sediminis TaxID=379071 RepID=UPI002350F73D|nr:hypothetical protein [Gilvibacter sediminis]MDC7997032.1 hypothetical protein [Gilvibacter sediminis]